MKNDILKALITEEELHHKVAELGKKISEDYRDKNLLMVSVLKGSVVFMADLMREVTIPCEIDFMCVSSYGSGVKTSGVVKIIKDLDINLKDRDLLIVEDILDSGMTLSYIKTMLEQRGTRSIKICTLLDKPERRQEKKPISKRIILVFMCRTNLWLATAWIMMKNTEIYPMWVF